MAERVHVWVQQFHDRKNLCLQWHDPTTGDRKTKTAGTADPDQARDAAAVLSDKLTTGQHVEPSRMSWDAFAAAFMAEYAAGRRPNTQNLFRRTLALFAELAAPGRLSAVNERTLSAFLAALRTRPTYGRPGMAPGSMKVHLQYLRTALHWAAGQGLIPRCPKFPAIKVPKKRPQPVPAESVDRLFAQAPDADWRALLLTLWLAGLRRSEAWALEWEETDQAPWLDLARRRIVFPAAFVKADEDQWTPLAPELQAALEVLPRAGRRVFALAKPGGGRMSKGGVGGRIIRWAKRAGVRLSAHRLRAGFGCRHAGKVPAQVLQRLMRHADIATTMDYYANIDAAVEEAVFGADRSAPRSAERRKAGKTGEKR